MSVIRKVKAVEKVFAALDNHMSSFRQTSGIGCVSGCGKCCFKAEIEATPLEFLPLAFNLLVNKQLDKAYEDLLERSSPACAVFSPVIGSSEKGFCGEYMYRGLICRLFGFSAMRDKNGSPKFVTCKTIKESQAEKVERLTLEMQQENTVPMMSDYYFRLRSIDPELGTKLMPINMAMRKAMEVVMSYYAYRKPPSGYKKLSA